MMETVDFDQARFNMVEQQIRTWDVLDPVVLDLLMKTPREAFVPDTYRNLAYADIEIPLGHGEVMMSPKIEAHIVQALDVQSDDKALEVGTGSGYLTALLAKLAKQVFSVEIHADLQKQAASHLASQGINNVTLEVGDASEGWNSHAPYDVIAITGSYPEVPEVYKKALTIGGRLFVIVGETTSAKEALIITRRGESVWETESLFETDIPFLANAEKKPEFEF